MKSKRSKQWHGRMHAALVQHLIAADPEYAFEAAVLGERGMREKYTHRQLHELIYNAKRTAQINKAEGFTIPKQVGQLNVTLVGGGGGGGSGQVNVSNPYGGGGGGSSHAADALKYALPPLMLPLPPKK